MNVIKLGHRGDFWTKIGNDLIYGMLHADREVSYVRKCPPGCRP